MAIVSDITDMHEKAFALAVCVSEENNTIIRELLPLGCDPLLKHGGISALARCTHRDDCTLLSTMLESYLPLDQFDSDSRAKYRIKRALDEALFEAASFCSVNCVEYLLHVGANCNCYSYHDDEFLSWCTPIIAACYAPICKRGGPIEVTQTVNMLMKCGSDINKENHMKDTALHWASAAGLADVIKMFVCNGADVNHCNSVGKTPLMSLAEKYKDNCQYDAVVDILIRHGADLELIDSTGWTAMHYAIQHSALRLVQLLLTYGAKTESPSIDQFKESDQTPLSCLSCLSLAIQLQRIEIVKTLLTWNADATVALSQVDVAYMLENIDLAMMLYCAGAQGLEDIHKHPQQLSSLAKSNLKLVECWEFPRPLLLLCRTVIRHNLGRRVVEEKLDLPIPPALINYITNL